MSEIKDSEILDTLTETQAESWMMLNTDGIGIPVHKIKETVISHGGIDTEVRIYYPDGEGPYPTVFFIHGGAFVGGFNGMDEPICRQMCHDAGCAVISPNYRLAPEYKWPNAINELYDLLKYLKAHAADYFLDMERLAVGGSSAGGNYAAALCVMNHERKDFDFKYQILFYPCMEISTSAGERLNSLTMWDGDIDGAEKSLADNYVPQGEDFKNPLISPLYGPSEAFPRTALFSGRCDLLWWEGKKFAMKLIEAGVETIYKCYANIGHGFLELANERNIQVSRDAKRIICQELKQNL